MALYDNNIDFYYRVGIYDKEKYLNLQYDSEKSCFVVKVLLGCSKSNIRFVFYQKLLFDIKKNHALVILLYMKFFVQFYGFAYKNYVKKLHDRFNN